MEKLSDYLKNNQITYEAFAQVIGSTATTVYRYCKGLRTPCTAMMRRIATATNGAVTANDFMGE